MRFQSIITYTDGLEHKKVGNIGTNGPFMDDFAKAIAAKHPEWGINKETFANFEEISTKEAKELDTTKVTDPYTRLKIILNNKARTYELLYTKNKSFKESKSITQDVADFDKFINTIVDTLYDKEIEIAKFECRFKDEELKNKKETTPEITDKNSEQLIAEHKEKIKDIKKNHLMNSGLTLASTRNDLSIKDVQDTFIKHLSDKNETLEHKCNSYKALEEGLKRKNPIARFFSFGTKFAMWKFRNEIAKSQNVNSRKEIDQQINKNASLAKDDLMNEELLNKIAFDVNKELDNVVKDVRVKAAKSNEMNKLMSPSANEVLKNKKNDVKLLNVDELDERQSSYGSTLEVDNNETQKTTEKQI